MSSLLLHQFRTAQDFVENATETLKPKGLRSGETPMTAVKNALKQKGVFSERLVWTLHDVSHRNFSTFMALVAKVPDVHRSLKFACVKRSGFLTFDVSVFLKKADYSFFDVVGWAAYVAFCDEGTAYSVDNGALSLLRDLYKEAQVA